MIAHLFSKVYLAFDTTLRPAYDNLIVSAGGFSIYESFINRNIGMGTNHGTYNRTENVDWPAFFNNVNNRRTVVYADPGNFTKIYFSFLKTVSPNITFENAKKIFEIVLKRATFYAVDYDSFGLNRQGESKDDISQAVAQIRESYEYGWYGSSPWALSQSFIDKNIGIELLVGRYWAHNQGEEQLKTKLEEIWWKCFVGWGEEASKMYSQRWIYENSDANPLEFISEISNNEQLSWMADPDLNLERTSEFKLKHDWSTIEKIWNFMKQDQEKGLIIELEPHWQAIIDKNWSAILNKNAPMTLLAPASEPVYRLVIIYRLVSYFANHPIEKLKEFV